MSTLEFVAGFYHMKKNGLFYLQTLRGSLNLSAILHIADKNVTECSHHKLCPEIWTLVASVLASRFLRVANAEPRYSLT